MKTLKIAAVAATAMLAFAAAAEAQQRVQRTQPTTVQNGYAPNAPYQTDTCEIFRVWIAESGVVFACDGVAMVFDGGNEPSSRIAVAAMLLDMAASQRAATVRYRLVNHAACAEIDFTSYSAFESGQCGEAVFVGNSSF